MTKSNTRLIMAEEIAKKSPAFKNFLRGMNNVHTRSDYCLTVNKFMEFNNLGEDYDKVVKMDTSTISNMITSFLDVCRDRGIKNSSMRTYLMGIERLFIMNDALFYKDRIRRGLEPDIEVMGGQVPVTTEELESMLQHTKSLRTKCLVHFLADTGMRPGGLNDPVICKKHLVEMTTPQRQKCYGLKIYDGSKFGYWSFLTPESTKLLDKYFKSREAKGELLSDESRVFLNFHKCKNDALTTAFARVTIAKLIIEAGVKRVKVGKHRYDKSVMYMFRKRFNTILKLNNDLNSNIAEKLMAHKKGLDGTYLQPTREECFAEFVKAIPELTIDPAERQKITIQKKQEEISELQKEKERGTQKDDRISKIEQLLVDMLEKNLLDATPENKKVMQEVMEKHKINTK